MDLGIPIVLVLIAVGGVVVAAYRRRPASPAHDSADYEEKVHAVGVTTRIELEHQEAELRKRNFDRATTLLAPQASTEEFVVVDVETTGFDAARHQITQVAAKRYRNLREEEGKITWDSEQFCAYCRLRPKSRIPMEVQSLTGITPDLLRREGRPIEDVIRELHAFIGTSLLVAHNAEFDARFLQAAAALVDLQFTGKILCTLKLSRQAWPERGSYKLAQLAEHVGADATGAHNAIRDIEMTFAVFIAALRATGKLRRLSA